MSEQTYKSCCRLIVRSKMPGVTNVRSKRNAKRMDAPSFENANRSHVSCALAGLPDGTSEITRLLSSPRCVWRKLEFKMETMLKALHPQFNPLTMRSAKAMRDVELRNGYHKVALSVWRISAAHTSDESSHTRTVVSCKGHQPHAAVDQLRQQRRAVMHTLARILYRHAHCFVREYKL